MIEYIYIVKCPDREDEMFNFFTDARMQCDLLMSKKPSITQVEVERNDFGECTDSHDLGTVWSWEEAMKDTEGDCTEAEPTVSIFTKDDLKRMADGSDPEFDSIDNSVDFEVEEPVTSEISAIDDAPDNFRKPIPEGMTIEELVEEMEENEDTVECTWCEDLFDKSECRYEVNLGWLCDRCQSAIMSRGESLTFREGNYWDFLDESADPEEVHDLGNTYDGGYPTDSTNELTEASLSDIAAAANGEYGAGYSEHELLANAGVEDMNFFDDLETPAQVYAQSYRNKRRRQAYAINKAKAAKTDSMLEELEDADSYKSHLVMCPECGFETLDVETGICINCGFNSLLTEGIAEDIDFDNIPIVDAE